MVEKIGYDDLLSSIPELKEYNACYAIDLSIVLKNVEYFVIKNAKSFKVEGAFCIQEERRKGIIHMCNPSYFQNIGLWIEAGKQNNFEANSKVKKVLSSLGDFLNSFKWVNISLPHNYIDGLPFYWLGFELKTRYTYRLAISNLDELLLNVSKGLKRDILRIEKSGVKFLEKPDKSSVSILKHYTASHRNSEEKEIWEVLFQSLVKKKNFYNTCAAHEENRGVASFLDIGKETVYLFGGSSKTEGIPLGTSALWEAISLAQKRGIQVVDFEGSMMKGVEKYFRSFGGDQTPFLNLIKEPFFLKILRKLRS